MKINNEVLTEAEHITIEQSIEQERSGMASADEIIDTPDQIYSELDRALKIALRVKKRSGGKGNGTYPNILFIGEGGTGKTYRIEKWAAARNINLVLLKAGELDLGDMGGGMQAGEKDYGGDIGKRRVFFKLPSAQLDQLMEPNSVLFLDEYNRATGDVRQQLLTLVQSHTITDSQNKGGKRELPNFLFTVAAINPDDTSNYTEELEQPEWTRFKSVYVQVDVGSYKNYLLNDILKDDLANADDEEERKEVEGQIRIATTLLNSPDFEFDGSEERKKNPNSPTCAPRSFENAIINCDGTKDDFLNNFRAWCGPSQYDTVRTIISNYQDADDEANQVLDKYEDGIEVNATKKRKSSFDTAADWAKRNGLA